jgi:hypothetical protein
MVPETWWHAWFPVAGSLAAAAALKHQDSGFAPFSGLA